jgi:hypothetical protein
MLYTDNVYGPRSTASGALEAFYRSEKDLRLSRIMTHLYFDYAMNNDHHSRSIGSCTINKNDYGGADICEIFWQQ